MSTFPDSLLNASFVTESSSGDEEELMPWEQDDFVPRTSSGRQRSPNNIRNQLQRYYMDGSSETETAIIERMGVSYDDFYAFMNPSKAYKTNQWAALENKTYWAAARWLEQAKHEAKIDHQASKKRKTVSGLPSLRDTLASNPFSNRGRLTREHRAMTPPLVALVDEMELPSVIPVYDSSREVAKKVRTFHGGHDTFYSPYFRILFFLCLLSCACRSTRFPLCLWLRSATEGGLLGKPRPRLRNSWTWSTKWNFPLLFRSTIHARKLPRRYVDFME
jgi:hypothetical protein